MQQPVINDSTIYFIILLGLFFLYRVWQSIQMIGESSLGLRFIYQSLKIVKSQSLEIVKKNKKSFPITAFNLLLWGIAVLFIASGFFYWRLRNIALLQPGIETFLVSLDIVLAHLVTTVPVILVFLFLLWKILDNLSIIALLLIGIFIQDVRKLLLITSSVMFILSGLISWLAVYILLINTIDLQMFLFGAHDPTLGIVFPTTFRFSVVSSHVQATYQTAASNQLVAGIFGLITVIIGVILGTASIIKAVDDIGNNIKPSDDDVKK